MLYLRGYTKAHYAPLWAPQGSTCLGQDPRPIRKPDRPILLEGLLRGLQRALRRTLFWGRQRDFRVVLWLRRRLCRGHPGAWSDPIGENQKHAEHYRDLAKEGHEVRIFIEVILSQMHPKSEFPPVWTYAPGRHFMAQSPIKRFKIVLLGDGGSGKTAFIHRHLTGDFQRKYIATLGVDVHPLLFHTNRGTVVLDCWDTAGQEKFGGLRDGYYTEAKGAILFFDVGAKITYRNLSQWRDDLLRVTGPVPLVVCGNKVDLKDRAVHPAEITVHRKWPDTVYYDVSAKSNYNYEKPFLSLLRRLMSEPDLEILAYPVDGLEAQDLPGRLQALL